MSVDNLNSLYYDVIYSPEATQLDRLMSRNSFTRAQATSRIRSQMPLEEKCRLASHVIDNSGDVEHTREQTEELYEMFCKSKAQWKVRVAVLFMFSLWLLLMIVVGKHFFNRW